MNPLLKGVLRDVAKERRITNECLLSLHSIYRAKVAETCSLIDKQCVVRLKSTKSGRVMYKVENYTVLLSPLYCSCGFSYQMEEILCAHILATLLLKALGGLATKEVVDDELATAFFVG